MKLPRRDNPGPDAAGCVLWCVLAAIVAAGVVQKVWELSR